MIILTYNVHLWEGRDGRMDIDRLAAIIESAIADVVSLNEVFTRYPRTTARAVPWPIWRTSYAWTGPSARAIAWFGGPAGGDRWVTRC